MAGAVLWVDDQIDKLQPYVNALVQRGVDLHTASSCDQAMKKLVAKDFAAVIVDLRMPEKDGIEVIRGVLKHRNTANICVYSSYLYLDEYIKKLRGLSRPILMLDKDFPNVNADDFEERFVAPLMDFISNGGKKSVSQQLRDQQGNTPDDPFDVDYNSFVRMSVLEKKNASDRAYDLAQDTLIKEFQRGAIWVFLCGDRNTIRASATTLSQVHSAEKMHQFARAQNRAPYQFFKPVLVDDMDAWSDCGEQSSLSNYPTANIELNNQKLLVHFDTGAPCTFFSYEELIERRVLRPNDLLFTTSRRGLRKYDCAFLDIEVTLRCQLHDDTQTIRLRGQVVRDWLNSPFVRECTQQQCVQLGQTIRDGKNCLLRIGLIGRNVLVENALQLILDGKERKTGFVGGARTGEG
jgi:CheY-like chemotaxis protein